jgi:hypothetical protein
MATETHPRYNHKRDIHQIFDDLEAYLNFCRIELRKFDPAELYQKNSNNYGAYLASKRPYKPYKGNNQNKPYNKSNKRPYQK